MKKLIKNARVLNGFTRKIEKANILIEDEIIIGVGDYYGDSDADQVIDIEGRIVTPSFSDGHIHIESTMLSPRAFAEVCIPHGTGVVMADPHEIANVCGLEGVNYMRNSSKGLPLDIYYVIPSCVPASPFDENGATITAKDIEPFFEYEDVLGLGEMMNFPGVIGRDPEVMAKIQCAHKYGKIVGGHAPLLRGKDLDKYISAGIYDDHECSNMEEALEKMKKGQKIMIRQGTAARNLNDLIDLVDPKYVSNCMFVTDDKGARDLAENGHIDAIVREAIKQGKDPITAYVMATANAPQNYGLKKIGYIAPGYYANLLILNDFENVDIKDVYYHGERVYKDKEIVCQFNGSNETKLSERVKSAFKVKELKVEDLHITPENGKCRIIKTLPGNLTTEGLLYELDFGKANGIDVDKDIIKVAVVERHKGTGHIGLGFVQGLNIKHGAIAQSIAHDSHNLIIAGTNEEDMVKAANQVINSRGGICVVCNDKILDYLPLPIAGLMSDSNPREVIDNLDRVEKAALKLGNSESKDIFIKLSFIALPVIPSLKMTTKGLVDVDEFKFVTLFEK